MMRNKACWLVFSTFVIVATVVTVALASDGPLPQATSSQLVNVSKVDGALPEVLATMPKDGQPVARIKDIARVEGVRSNQLVGVGLVVGLAGTGDGSGAGLQMVSNMLQKFGISVSASELRMRNIAMVSVTAELPPFARPGDTIDVTVSSIGNAKSLQGGLLLQTPLTAADGQVYAVAQGAVSIGGFEVGSGGSSAQKNHPTVGRVPEGAIVEGRVLSELVRDNKLTLLLHEPDFTTSSRVANVINQVFADGTAKALDGSAVEVAVPAGYSDRIVDFVSALAELPVVPDTGAKVVINERTGTVVIGHRVRIATVAVAHGGLTVQVRATDVVSQPPAFSEGETVVTTDVAIEVEEQAGAVTLMPSGASVGDLVKALNAIGATPRDIIAILQAIKEAGALYGELEII